MMLKLLPDADRRRPLRLLCLGAHCDDIEIGCGGTILKLLSEYRRVHVHWVVFSGDEKRQREARHCARLFLRGADTCTIELGQFRDGYFPSEHADIKDRFEQLKTVFVPDIIFTHYHADAHQDHRLICELTWNTWRNHMILEYEIPKYDGDLGHPNMYFPLSAGTTRRKIRHLLKTFTSQRRRHWFTEDTFMALMRLRGLEAHSESKLAEAFYGRKLVLK